MSNNFNEMVRKQFNNFGNFDEFLTPFTMGFGFPRNVKFNTPGTKDLMPSYWKEWYKYKDGAKNSDEKEQLGYYCVCRTIGINPECIKVEETEDGLIVKGETEVKETGTNTVKYSQYIELPIAREIMDAISHIEYTSKNGLTYVYVGMTSKIRRNIPIGRLAEDENGSTDDGVMEYREV